MLNLLAHFVLRYVLVGTAHFNDSLAMSLTFGDVSYPDPMQLLLYFVARWNALILIFLF